MGTKQSKITAKKMMGKMDMEKQKYFRKKFREEELEVLVRIFANLAEMSEEDTIDKRTFQIFFKLPGILSERLWDKFDIDNDHSVTLEEFLTGLAMSCKGSQNEQAKFIFDIYDFHGDGFIHKDDIVMILHNLKPTNTKVQSNDNIVSGVKTNRKRRTERFYTDNFVGTGKKTET